MDICFISNGKINKLKNCIFRSIYCSLPVVLIRLKLIHISFKKKRLCVASLCLEWEIKSKRTLIITKSCQNVVKTFGRFGRMLSVKRAKPSYNVMSIRQFWSNKEIKRNPKMNRGKEQNSFNKSV